MHMFITGFANIWLLPGGRTNLSRPCFFKYLKGREHFPPYRFGLISALHFLDACSILVKYLLLHAPGWKKGIWLHAKTSSSSFDIWPSFSKRSSSSCSFRTGTRYFARDVPKRRLLPSRESGVKSFKRRYSNFPWEIFNSSGLEQIFVVVEFDCTICKLF